MGVKKWENYDRRVPRGPGNDKETKMINAWTGRERRIRIVFALIIFRSKSITELCGRKLLYWNNDVNNAYENGYLIGRLTIRCCYRFVNLDEKHGNADSKMFHLAEQCNNDRDDGIRLSFEVEPYIGKKWDDGESIFR